MSMELVERLSILADRHLTTYVRQVILKHRLFFKKQPFTIDKGYYVTNFTKKYCSTPYLLSRIALRLLKIIEPYLGSCYELLTLILSTDALIFSRKYNTPVLKSTIKIPTWISDFSEKISDFSEN